MAKSAPETGNAINVGNFATLISYCTSFGTRYNPANNAIKVAAMQTLQQQAATALTTVNSKNVVYTMAVDDREAAFAMVDKLLARIRSTMIACGATKAQLQDARTIINKIRGAKKKPAATAPTTNDTNTTPDTPTDPIHEHSESQRSYINIANHFHELAQLAANIPTYDTNETELKADSLQTLYETMTELTQTVTNAFIQLTTARINRDRLLYAEGTGLVDLGLASKNYIKATFLNKSPEYMKVASIKFKRPKKKQDFSKYTPVSSPA